MQKLSIVPMSNKQQIRKNTQAKNANLYNMQLCSFTVFSKVL